MPRRILAWTTRHTMVGWALAVALFALWPVRWALDREPPFAITGPVTVVNPEAGGEVFFDMPVRRDIERECSATFARYMIDAKGFRRDFDRDPRHVSADAIRAMELRMDGRLQLAIPTAYGMPPGRSTYTTILQYRCNPLHAWWPIEVTMTLEFEVLP